MVGGGYLGNAATFLVSVVFGVYILIVMLRFLFQLVHADFYNPISQFVVTATNPPLRHMRRIIPGWAGIDLSSLLLLLVLQFIEQWLIFLILGQSPGVIGLLVLAVAELLLLAYYVFLFAIIVQVVISWVNPGVYNPVIGLLYSLTEPILAPVRRLMPPLSGLDLSPLVATIGLVLIRILLIAPIHDLGQGLALGRGGLLP